MKTTADNDLISPEAVERLALAIRGACDCALGSSAEQPVGQTLRALAARLAEVEAQLKATLDREAATYARHDARADLCLTPADAEALVTLTLKRAAEVAAYEAGFVPVKEEDFRRAILALLDAPAPSEDRT